MTLTRRGRTPGAATRFATSSAGASERLSALKTYSVMIY
jgi:hypothetical protein